MINELYSKLSASLDEILDAEGNPSKGDILNSKDFQINLINDLIQNKKNVTNWQIQNQSVEDVNFDPEKDFKEIDYEFTFKYKYKESEISLTMFIQGNVDIDWVGGYIPASRSNPEEYPEAKIDYKNLGRSLDLALFDNEGEEISLQWLTPELQRKVVKSIISPYL